MYVYMYIYIYIHTYTYIHIYIYIVLLCLSVGALVPFARRALRKDDTHKSRSVSNYSGLWYLF